MEITIVNNFDEYLAILRKQTKKHDTSLVSKNVDTIIGFESPDGWWGVKFNSIVAWASKNNHKVATPESYNQILYEAIKDAIEGGRRDRVAN